MLKIPPINTILVPQGAEYQAVKRGLNRASGEKPTVIAIPVGVQPLRKYLQKWTGEKNRILLMGLCGSLQTHHAVGDIVLYKDCTYQEKLQKCNNTLTAQIQTLLSDKVTLVKSLTSDRLIWAAAEKRYLGQTSGADVVDMEGYTALEYFPTVAILRVVSDNAQHDIPDLTSAISLDGSLKPVQLAIAFFRQPLAATRLIRGSLRGLKVLEQITTTLFST
ncbi:5'-methylthioadenosine/S-adenosylhomocysteine nucleosidase family protein [Cylindrospermum sp. FACHB-282]|uniref:5'-methylthioadenosine/S-adenosylhomocysteine nucleosidase family protein n=1 Tax=Cylindrospermum sp. FACHB-282 TaxID=2692794 RepID=UPI00168335F9|nr:phosphorylase [Cylindrospermum sp. FACHB-282]MBD2384981.1 phosphorylase [Cylindrospermum sp. FACHB-282]